MPDHMSMLTLLPSPGDKKIYELHRVIPRTDWAIFQSHGPMTFVELDSSSLRPTRSPSTHEKDELRGLAHAAFVVRLTNIALGIDNFCLPVIWVSKTWKARCSLRR